MATKALSLRKAALKLGIHHNTLKKWIVDGEGPKAFVKPGVHRDVIRIMPEELDRYIRVNSLGGPITR